MALLSGTVGLLKQRKTGLAEGLSLRHSGINLQQHVARQVDTHILPDTLKGTTCHITDPRKFTALVNRTHFKLKQFCNQVLKYFLQQK